MNQANQALRSILKSFSEIGKPVGFLKAAESSGIDLGVFESIANWERIPDEWIFSEFEALCFADAEEFQFLLPAFMSYAIRNVFSSSVAVDYTIYALNPAGVDVGKFARFSEDQKESIRLFLRFMAANPEEVDGAQALKAMEYWG